MSLSILRILIVEDDELFRLGLVTRLSQEPALLITEAEDGETAIALVNQQLFDLVVLDVGLPGIGGMEACRQIKQSHPNLPVLVLTSHSQPALIAQLIESKANGFCVKGISSEKLILAIRSLTAGATWWDAIASQEIQSLFENSQLQYSQLQPYQSKQIAASADNPLTKREQEILSLIANGKSNQQIANILNISSGTVRVHVHTILHKLQVSDRAHATMIALNRGLI